MCNVLCTSRHLTLADMMEQQISLEEFCTYRCIKPIRYLLHRWKKVDEIEKTITGHWPSNASGQRSVKLLHNSRPSNLMQVLSHYREFPDFYLCSKIVAKIPANQLPCEEPQVNYPVGMHKLQSILHCRKHLLTHIAGKFPSAYYTLPGTD